ncbi:HAD family hydrolase [Ruegeria sp. 6PALISEP08]|uniref:HAD family hydrolase n=1 Tax=Ruegeria sp. 6PALISEP08 TaxID=1225660 RepID=UPI00067EF294|nr:HAD family hydrolase [Ruegeria sp. 6PALISEP08]
MTPPVLYFDLGNTLVHGPSDNRVPLPDAVATIETLWQRGYRIGILSNQPVGMTQALMIDKLNDYGLDAAKFDAITFSSEFDPPKSKPDPEIFDHALSKVGYTAGSIRTVFITETLNHIEAARNLGWRAIHTPYNATCTTASGECVEALDDLLDLFPPLEIDVYMRDNSGDDGDEPSSGSFWNSPDLWIRNQNDGGTAHQNPEAGTDNWFHTRLHNRGEGIARLVLVTHAVQEWAGTQFVHPNDFVPHTAMIGILNLVPDEPQIAVVKWEADNVPPEGTHACWLSAAYFTGDAIATGSHVWDSNNLGQKNLSVVEMAPGETAEMAFVIGNRAVLTSRRVVLELWQSVKGPMLSAAIRSQSAPALGRAVRRSGIFARVARSAPPRKNVGLRFLTEARVELTELLDASNDTAVFDLAPGSEMTFPPGKTAEKKPRVWPDMQLTARLRKDAKGNEEVVFDRAASSGIALGLRECELLPATLRLTAPKDASEGDRIRVDLVQRDDDGTVIGGISVSVVIRARKSRKSPAKRRSKTARKKS